MQRQFLQCDRFIDLTLFGKQAFLPEAEDWTLSDQIKKPENWVGVICNICIGEGYYFWSVTVSDASYFELQVSCVFGNNPKGGEPIAKLLQFVNSFLLSTNEKPLFFPKPIQLVPKHCFLILIFFYSSDGNRDIGKKQCLGPQLLK